MNRWVASAVFLAGLGPAWGQTLEITGGLVVTVPRAAPSSLLRVGPLVPTGLIHELCLPLGAAAGSSVIGERAGFTVDTSAARPPGFVCAPGPIGIFGQPRPDGAAECGVFFNSVPGLPWRAEAAAWFSEPPPSSSCEDWYRDAAAYPGGTLVGTGARLSASAGGLSAGITLGASAGERTPPGWLVVLDGQAAMGPLEASLLVGACTAGYRSPAGAAADAAWRASGLLRLSGADNAAQLRTTVDIGRPGFAPSRFIPMRQDLALQVDRFFAVGGPSETAALRLSADKRIALDAQGSATEESSCTGRLTVSIRGAAASLALSWSADSGATSVARVQLDPVTWMSVDVEAAWSDHDQSCTLGVRCAIKAGASR